jgi:cbb3-type cytochrome oxidase subunit 3
MIHLKKLSLLAALAISLFCLTANIIPVSADDSYGLDTAAKGTGLISKATTPQIIIGNVVGAILSFVGVAFFLLIFYGGIRWMLAEGNEQEVEIAKKIIVAAFIGLVIVLAAYAITAFIGERLTAAGA